MLWRLIFGCHILTRKPRATQIQLRGYHCISYYAVNATAYEGRTANPKPLLVVPKPVFPKQRIYSIEGEFLREEPEEPNPEG